MSNLPRIGITMGDAAGIGPEIIVKALSHRTTYQLCSPLVIGSASIIRDALKFSPHPLEIRRLDPPPTDDRETWKLPDPHYGQLDILDVVPLQSGDIPLGTAHPLAGEASVKILQNAVQLALHKRIDAITTAPICKAAVHLAGYPYPGHTEMLADFTQTPRVVMMLASDHLRVSFVTSHIPLAEVPNRLSIEKIVDVISVTHNALTRLGIISPKLAVAALNPHAGEWGVLGKEEETIITPALESARAQGYTVEGPLPADTLFVRAKENRWDAVIAMYHDQGSIPIKMLGFGQVVNVTLGLPIIRTSVDHGTAFDIAGQGIASESSLIAALKFAVSLSKRR